MVFFNWATMQMAAKIVYYGPGLCGKTSNLSCIYAKTSPNSRGEMVSLETESDRTLFFDLLPIEVGTIGGFKTRLQLYTVPGQVFYNTTRKLVLKGVDGLVFVADSQRPMREANLESFATLRENLNEIGLDMDDLPLVLQYNKRDLKNVLTIEELNEDLNKDLVMPYFEASAIEGTGVFETLKQITKLTLKKLRRRMASPQPSTSPKPRLTTSTAPSAPAPALAPSQPVKPTPPPAPEPAPAPAPPPAPAPRSPSVFASALARAAEEGVDGDDMPAADPGPAFGAQPSDDPGPAFGAPPSEPAEPEIDPDEVTAPSDEPFGESEEAATAEAAADELEEIGEVEQPTSDVETLDAEEEAVEDIATLEASDEAPGDKAEETEQEPEATEKPKTAASASGPGGTEEKVEFDQTGVDVQPPPMKRVKVSNQLDILAELDGLRKQATMRPAAKKDGDRSKDLDLDSLLGGGSLGGSKSRDVRRRIEESVNSDVFERMHSVQLALRIQTEDGETIHTLAPVSLEVNDASDLERVILQLTVDVKNLR